MDHPRAHRRLVPVVVGVALIQLVGTRAAQHGQPDRHQLDAFGYVLLLLGPALLLLRHRFPLAVCLGTTAVGVVYLLADFAYGPILLSVVVGFVGAVLSGHRKGAWLSLSGLYLVHLVLALATGTFRGWQELGLLAWLLLLVLAAEVVRNKSEQREQRRQVRAEREQRIADEQRMAIARELHDVLAHSISLINIQAGVALELLDGDPEQARSALTTIKQTSKEALGEVRQVLGTLRTPAPRVPAPTLDRLGELVTQARTAGLTVTLRTHRAARPLPPGVELAAFRIVQEALTNVIRHSSARTAEVDIHYGSALTLDIRDPGPLSAAGGPRAGGSGSGLTGMRERVAALGGSVTAAPDGAGFHVHAELPLTTQEP
ncbi:sensor histidine kinase [Streptacidiphilus sp. N1-12]|uniref:histidine kinase n=2 Tax=Streptacidiphilus alkalitolerans TaxID=3342712 RepID=A0ABV6V2Q9_9ACTN